MRKYKWQLIWLTGVVTMMFAHVDWHYAIVITIGVIAFLIIDSPDIKRIVMNNKGVALEKQQEKIDKALVEYDEFKKTIYPLFEMLMTNVVFHDYLGVSSTPANLIDFLNRVEKLPLGVETDPKMVKLITAMRVKVIDAFTLQLMLIRQNSKLDSNLNYCISVNSPRIDGGDYLNSNDVVIDFKKLEESGNDFSDSFKRKQYMDVIKQLKDYYDTNF